LIDWVVSDSNVRVNENAPPDGDEAMDMERYGHGVFGVPPSSLYREWVSNWVKCILSMAYGWIMALPINLNISTNQHVSEL
jgi:hypothetical protein